MEGPFAGAFSSPAGTPILDPLPARVRHNRGHRAKAWSLGSEVLGSRTFWNKNLLLAGSVTWKYPSPFASLSGSGLPIPRHPFPSDPTAGSGAACRAGCFLGQPVSAALCALAGQPARPVLMALCCAWPVGSGWAEPMESTGRKSERERTRPRGLLPPLRHCAIAVGWLCHLFKDHVPAKLSL